MRVIDKHPPLRSRAAGLTLAAILGFCLLAGLGLFRIEFLRQVVRSPKATLIDTPRNYLEARRHRIDLPGLRVDMKYRHYEKILAKRTEALERGLLFTGDEDLVPATVTHEGRTVRVKMRLKGDWPDHFRTDKWSYRIQTRGGDHVLGMRRFSVQHPEARNFLGERLYFENLRKEGVLTPRYEFVRLVFNGNDLGIFALEEHMAKELVESQARREGPVLKFDENPLWAQRAKARDLGWFPLDQLTYRNATIDQFAKKDVAESPVLAEQSRAAIRLLDGFRTGTMPASEVFDVDLMARFLAVTRLWGAHHALIWHNLRFYYNPVTARLEPIAFDGEPSPWTRRDMWQVRLMGGGDALWVQIHAWDHWTGALLEDPALARAYLEHLHRVSEPAYVEALENDWSERTRDLLMTLRTEWPLLEGPFPALHRGAAFLRGKLLPEAAVAARWADDGRAAVQVANVVDVPMEVLAVRAGERSVPLDPPLTLPAHGREEALDWIPVPVAMPAASGPPESTSAAVAYRTLAGTSVRDVAVAPPPPLFAGTAGAPRAGNLDSVLVAHPFLERDGTGIRIPAGEWNVNTDIVLPDGVKVTVEGGAILRFAADALFLARGPMELRGSAARPVVLTGASGTWPGLVCLEAQAPSTWTHVRVENTRSTERPGWLLTGGVTFYESPVTLTECAFAGSAGEDALNIIRSEFAMLRCVFSDAASDAFDGDFVTGKIHDSVFHDITGDGIDVSGSRLEIKNLRAWSIGDKAVSVGEASEARLFDVDLQAASIGVAAKDLSRALLQGGRGRDLGIAFAAYTKKAAYGPGRIEAEDFILESAERTVMVQTGSSVRLGEEEFEGVPLDVKELYRLGVLGN